ncbi:MAG TPA: hypothetical protein PLS69_08950 [Terricaulis sp.]|nr:hypothetical protein [Terricaulis sp.]HRP09856.1 hypothetical protein [Terricaulis sp.]
MTKLDIVFQRVRSLPQEQQDVIAAELEAMLAPAGPAFQLTPAQEQELARRLAQPGKQYVSHEDVAAQFERKFGR